MEPEALFLSDLHLTSVIVVSLLLLMALCLLQAPLCTEYPRVPFWELLFTLYSQTLSDVISAHGCDFHKYADDTALSQSAPPDEFCSVQTGIQTCIEESYRG